MSKRTILHVVAALLLAVPATAQEQVGAVAGRVVDAEGGVLPGATVELSSPGSGTLVATTDARGRYRFPRVPPAVYTAKASLEGFQAAEVTAINVTLGQTATIELQLEVGEFTEEIVVTGERAQIDVTQSATATSIAREQLDLVPRGRDFTSVVGQAAGAGQEAFLGGLSIDGASGSENRFVLDGTDTTHPRMGLSGQSLVADFVEEVQVKSAGYEAEHGGSVGGVINVVTKSGTNQFRGSLGVDYETSSWSGDERPTPREDAQALCGSDSLLCTFDKDDETRLEPAFSLGGPIARDRAWFFVAYQDSQQELERTPMDASRSFDQEITRRYFSGNVKGNVGSRLLYKVSANLSPRKEEGLLPSRDGSTPADALVDQGFATEIDTDSYSAYVDYLPSSKLYLSARAGYYTTNQEDDDISVNSRFLFQAGEIPLPGSDPRHRPAGFDSTLDRANGNSVFTAIEQDEWQRLAGSLEANLFLTAAGEHSIKGGVQYELIENNVFQKEHGNLFIIRWGLADRFGAGVEGDFGSVEVRSFETVGDGIESDNIGFFLQDSWQMRPNFTLNLGVRAEQERIPNYPVNQPLYGEYAIEFDFDDKIAPRVGFAWDVLSDQRWKVYGSYGTYYDITKLEMPRGSFGGDRWVSYIYPLNSVDWASLDDSCHTSTNDPTDNVCPGLGTPSRRDLRQPSNPAESIDQDLKPMEQTEYQLGLDHQLTPNIVLGARYVNKSLEETIEDIGFLVCGENGCAENFIIGNPGRGQVAGDPPGPTPAQPEAVRDYQALTLSFERRLVDNWSLRASYTRSELEGNYSGLASSDEFGRTSPNVERYFDALHNAFDANGRQVIGPLTTERPNQVEIQATYRTRWGTAVGLNQYWGDGTPISEQVGYSGVPFFPEGRENVGRTDDLTQTDLQISHPFRIGRYELELAVNVLNLFDEDTVTRVQNTKYRQDLCSALPGCDGSSDYFFGSTPIDVDAALGGDPDNLNPFYLKPFGVNAFQAPREVRLGATFRF